MRAPRLQGVQQVLGIQAAEFAPCDETALLLQFVERGPKTGQRAQRAGLILHRAQRGGLILL